ncbi:hypothetical protein Tco_0775795 [Tanacetum coccineum]
MAEENEEKTGFQTEEGVYCFTHMPKELKNSAAKLQRMMEKVLTNQRGQNVEIYLEEIVIKSKSEPDMVQDVKEIGGRDMIPSEKERASIFNGISIQMFLPTSKRIQPDNNGGRGRRKDWVSYERRSILFHPHAERIKELYSYTLEDDGKGGGHN